MDAAKNRRPLYKRLLLMLAAAGAFILLFFIATQVATQQIFRGIESSRATGLASLWDASDLQASGDLIALGNSWISRSAALRIRTDSFDGSASSLRRIVASHQGSFEEFKTETRSGSGRSLVATLTVPAPELDVALGEIKSIGRADRISEAAEDSTIKHAALERHSVAARENLARLQKLYGQKASVEAAIALQKEISKAKEKLFESEKEKAALLSKVSQAFLRLTLLEEYRARLDLHFAGASLHVRNSLVEGLNGIVSSVSIFAGAFLQIGLPVLFWIAVLLFPSRLIWRRFRREAAIPRAP